MKKNRLLAVSFTIIAILLAFVACSDAKPVKYDVKVPILMGGSTARKIVANEEIIADSEAVSQFFAYRVAPPVIGFSDQKIEAGSTIEIGLKDLSRVTLTMSLDQDGNYVFEGSNGDDYAYVKVSKDNSKFDYIHVIKIYGEMGGTDDEFDVVVGQGKINDDNSFEGCGTLYYLITGNYNKRMRFVFFNNGQDEYGCYYYAGQFNGNYFGPMGADADPEKYRDYIQQAEYFEDSNLAYVSRFSEAGLDFSSLKLYSKLEDIPSEDAKNVIIEMGMESNVEYAYAIQSNGFGDTRGSLENCQAVVDSWEGFSNWNLSSALEEWDSVNSY